MVLTLKAISLLAAFSPEPSNAAWAAEAGEWGRARKVMPCTNGAAEAPERGLLSVGTVVGALLELPHAQGCSCPLGLSPISPGFQSTA